MIRISLFSLVAVLIFSLDASAQVEEGSWMPLTDAPSNNRGNQRFDDVKFFPSGIGWVVNTTGHIYRSDDRGTTWTLQKHDPNLTFRAAAFINEDVGFVGLVNSEPQVLYATDDGGSSWTNISSSIEGPTVQGICGMQAVNDSTVVGVGAWWGAPTFVKTVDGGESWQSMDMSSYAATLVDVHFFNDSTGIITGGDGAALDGQAVILYTNDGGASWSTSHQSSKSESVIGEWGWKISVPSDSTVYVSVEYNLNVTSDAKILKSTDQGQTWIPQLVTGSVDPAGLQAVGFINDSTGWVGGRGTTSVTTDGGLTWAQLEAYHPSSNPEGHLDARLNRMYILSDTVGYAVGKYAYRFAPALPVSVVAGTETPKSFTIEQNYPNPFNPSTTIAYVLHRPLVVTIKIYGPTGRVVRTLVNEQTQPVGRHQVDWDGRDSAGAPVASGIYFYVADIGDAIELKKMALIK